MRSRQEAPRDRPVSRGDLASIENHLQGLAPFGDDTLGLYRLLCQATVPLAVERGAIDAVCAQLFQALLAPARVPDRDPHGA